MSKQTCTQHGCDYDAEEPAETCPVCNNPQTDATGNGEPEWTDLTKAELQAQLDEWETEYSSRATKDELIELLEAAEADLEDDTGGE